MIDSLSPMLWMPLLAVLSTILIGVVRQILLHFGIMDIPNARSNHTQPVARGGGIAVMALLIGVGYWVGLPLDIIALALILTVLCFADDVRGLSARLKLAVQLLIVFAAWHALPLPDVARIVEFFGLPSVAGEVNGVPLASGYVILFGLLFIPVWVWWVNASNFLDGIDGISAVHAMTLGLGVLLVAPYLPDMAPFVPKMAAALLAVFTGFLLWNWHPAKIFLGDSGSVPVGFITGFLLWKLAASGAIVAALLLVSYALLDTTMTLLLRAARREHLLQAHSAHGYQRAVRRGMRHDQVVLRIVGLNMLMLVLAYFSLHGGWIALLCLLVGYAAAVGLWLHLGGGWRELCRNPAATA
jgi:UDP-N-acetylmuramyl pentapeptide phosphotransferase/UDP-N-acetylglucosamine-1-phosphate transferase